MGDIKKGDKDLETEELHRRVAALEVSVGVLADVVERHTSNLLSIVKFVKGCDEYYPECPISESTDLGET